MDHIDCGKPADYVLISGGKTHYLCQDHLMLVVRWHIGMGRFYETRPLLGRLERKCDKKVVMLPIM